ncbi:MAG: hypothetical protein NZ889_00095 [Candidatus Pacearchaeota archaeon]|nr:hypothetical protein [Candidatus Pacearchaeota archaeon]
MKDKIKEAFDKVKQDISELKKEVFSLKKQFKDIFYLLKKTQQINQEKQLDKFSHIKTGEKIKKLVGLDSDFQSSTGNGGVPTDRQTDRQTNRQTDNRHSTDGRIMGLVEDLRLLQRKFQNLTKQEFLVFSTLYILSSEKKHVTYKDLAMKTRLSESSIRDYISRLVRKEIPIIREKLNNKQILLQIPQEFRELAPLDVLTRMRLESY